MNASSSYSNWIGQWQPMDRPETQTFLDTNPLDDSTVGVFADSKEEEVSSILERAREAQRQHADLGPSVRESWLLSAANHLLNQEENIVHQLIDETGSPITKARREVSTAVRVLRAAAGSCRVALGDVLPSDVPDRISMAVREPLGVVLGITPFNVPLIKVVKHSALALATGNAVVILPSNKAPLMAALMAQIYETSGVPAGMFQVVFGDGTVIGDALTSHPLVDMIGFTGSTATGRRVAIHAAETGKRVTLEMGGKNAVVVLDDADLSVAIPAITMGAFLFQGQICMSTSRVFATPNVFEKLIPSLITAAEGLPGGDLHDPQTVLGPMINQENQSRVLASIQNAISQGAKLLTGGGAIARGVQPTILTDVSPGTNIDQREIFGPVCLVEQVEDLEHAIRRANQTPFGLVASIFTRSLAASRRFVRQSTAGMVHVNGPTIQEEPHVPFGGNGDSGFGREGSLVGIDELTRWKWFTMQ